MDQLTQDQVETEAAAGAVRGVAHELRRRALTGRERLRDVPGLLRAAAILEEGATIIELEAGL